MKLLLFSDTLGTLLVMAHPGRSTSIIRRAGIATILLAVFAATSCATKEFTDSGKRHIRWKAAVALIRNGAVKYVAQDHSLRVSLTTKDGHRYVTREPRIDAVWHLIREVDPKREHIRFATE